MTKKDYDLIAKAIKQATEKDGVIKSQTFHIIDNLCEAMKRENPRFDEARFNKACNAPYYGQDMKSIIEKINLVPVNEWPKKMEKPITLK